STGHVLGMISTHFAQPRGLDDTECKYLDVLARHAADYLERKRAEDALRTAMEGLRIVTDGMAAPVIRCSRDPRCVWVSGPYADWIGLPVDEIVGRRIVDGIGDDAFQQLRPHFERVLRGEIVHYEEQVALRGIGPRWVTATYTPTRDPDGACDGWV